MKFVRAAAVALPVLVAHAAPLAEPTCKDTDVLILGAGVAGLTAAQTLLDNGVNDFIVHGPGRPETGNVNPIWTMVERAKLNNVKTENEDRVVYPEKSRDAVQAALEEAETATGNDRSFRAGQRLQHWDPAKTDPAGQLADWWAWDWEAASPPEENSEVFGAISTIATYDYFSKGDYFVCDDHGYVSALRNNVSDVLNKHADRVLFNHKVTDIKHDLDGVTVTSDQECFKAKYAIVTFSLGVLQRGRVNFDPPLPPWKAQSIAGFEIGTYTKIFLKFKSSFWDKTQFLLWADPHVRGNYPVFQPLDIPGLYKDSNILVATVTGERSYRVESQTNEETAQELLEVLKNMYGDKVSELEEIYYPRWSTEDWSYGSYSYWPPSTSLQEHQNLRANVDSVFFAGEATSQEFFGYLHGAYYEGKHVAEFLAPCIRLGQQGCKQTNYDVLTGVTPYDLYNPVNGWYIYNETLGVPGHD
ncbi:polyamine oxidase [Aspergillus costaricaensis CBS 115574]|uniref:Polyamine oxidase n=1 Tax=Aspergillus costaricaensis CBS 115574 TaxID=1448317 RepID=A0ACD1ITQ3_9EURO|nr:polyamine oxidase [Aspergillus costaricaensis CBS 115574]RAK93449.1 polyamine oxidase [Aspergillus costaricaensis CBS 115574]